MLSLFIQTAFMSYLTSIAIRIKHITQGVFFMCGMDSANSSPALGQVHGVAENTE